MLESQRQIKTDAGRFRFATNFAIVLSSFLLLTGLSWPILLSFDLWIFKDRSSFLNLDYLFFTRHLKLGIDVCYTYGLLPVLLQHLAFVPFGRGFKPMIVCTLLVLPLFALFWALFLEHLPAQRIWLFAVVALAPLVYIVNPNWPYTLVTLSLLFALLFVLKNRLDIALALSAIGCFCVPSLPLVLSGLLALCIVFSWWRSSERSFSRLLTLLAPGALTTVALYILLGAVFGFRSMAATALPIAGARFYSSSGYGRFGAFLQFLMPDGHSTASHVAYYIGSHVSWFVLCSLFLLGTSFFILLDVLRSRTLTPARLVVVLFTLVLMVFIFFAYGARGQHVLYESELAMATLLGLATIKAERRRTAALLVYLAVGLLAASGEAYKTLKVWRTTAPRPGTLGLYADADIARLWSETLQTSTHQNTLLLSYATGQHIYYPALEAPDAWFMIPGLLYPGQESAIIDQIRHADLVIEDDTSPSPVISDSIKAALSQMHAIHPGGPFRILQH